MVGLREESKSKSLVVTGEEREGGEFVGMLVRIRMTSRWVDDSVRRQDGRRHLGRRDIGQEEERAGWFQ